MKLNDLTEDKNQEIYQWFVDNNVKLYSDKESLAPAPLFTSGDSPEKFWSYVDNVDDSTGILNMSNVYVKLPKNAVLKSAAPFKFGKLNGFCTHYINDISKLDLNSLTVTPNSMELRFNQTGGDVLQSVKLIRKAKLIKGLVIRASVLTGAKMKRLTGLMPAVQLIAESSNLGGGWINLPNAYSGKGKESDIIIADGKFNVWQIEEFADVSKEPMTIMDLQEWLFDNGYEGLL